MNSAHRFVWNPNKPWKFCEWIDRFICNDPMRTDMDMYFSRYEEKSCFFVTDRFIVLEKIKRSATRHEIVYCTQNPCDLRPVAI